MLTLGNKNKINTLLKIDESQVIKIKNTIVAAVLLVISGCGKTELGENDEYISNIGNSEKITIKDEGIKVCLEAFLEKQDGYKFPKNTLSQVHKLDCTQTTINSFIHSLDDLVYMPKLESIILGNQKLETADFSKLYELEIVKVYGNKELKSIQYPPNIEFINMNNTQLNLEELVNGLKNGKFQNLVKVQIKNAGILKQSDVDYIEKFLQKKSELGEETLFEYTQEDIYKNLVKFTDINVSLEQTLSPGVFSRVNHSINKNNFQYNQELKYLDFSSNELGTIDFMTQNDIDTLSEYFPNIDTLILTGVPLSKDLNISKLTKLSKIFLSNTGLESIFIDNVNLSELSIGGNNLTRLDISSTKINKLGAFSNPELSTIIDSGELLNLNISGTRVNTFDWIIAPESLQEVHINHIKYIHTDQFNLIAHAVESLDSEGDNIGNDFSEIPGTGGFENEGLNKYFNKIRQDLIQQEGSAYYNEIRSLSLDGETDNIGEISQSDWNILGENLVNITELSISDIILPNNINVSHFSQLTKVDISNAGIESINLNNSQLTQITLSSNNISSIDLSHTISTFINISDNTNLSEIIPVQTLKKAILNRTKMNQSTWFSDLVLDELQLYGVNDLSCDLLDTYDFIRSSTDEEECLNSFTNIENEPFQNPSLNIVFNILKNQNNWNYYEEITHLNFSFEGLFEKGISEKINSLTNISQFNNFTHLESLNLSGIQIDEGNISITHPTLKKLNINFTGISNISIGEGTPISSLSAVGNNLNGLSLPIDTLEILKLNNNKDLNNLDFIYNSPSLNNIKILELSNNIGLPCSQLNQLEQTIINNGGFILKPYECKL
ncbi:MAG: hypothetical protein GY828_04695 [Candidatus Gracilibacteria bacterium]|nr:hypothetical protein [Candidatus Gracilibacteria bacterium]